ncbi:hypothetical protein KY284_017200 [Solanum tuberosum]|nr:hypothetical protein KY284_017200 [Solanum tuberosum]
MEAAALQDWDLSTYMVLPYENNFKSKHQIPGVRLKSFGTKEYLLRAEAWQFSVSVSEWSFIIRIRDVSAYVVLPYEYVQCKFW